MKFFSSLLLTALLSYAAGLFQALPWYSFVFTALLVAIAVHQKPWKAFLAAFLAQALLWTALALMLDIPNEHILSTKVASVLPLGGSYIVLIIVTAVVGGLVSGLAALTGSYLRKK
jgi:hypothetical protein